MDRLRNMLKQQADGTWILAVRPCRHRRSPLGSGPVPNRWHEVADAGHYIHDDQPDAFERLVASFLAEPERPWRASVNGATYIE